MSRGAFGLWRFEPAIAVAAFRLAAFLVLRALRDIVRSEVGASLGPPSLGHLALGDPR
jgi:hypothetical protein